MGEHEEMKEGKSEKRSSSFLRGYIAGALTILLLGFGLFFLCSTLFNGLSIRENAAASRKLNQLASYLEDQYLGELNMEELLNGAYAGFVKAVGDPYTRYYTKEQYKEYQEELGGSYAGIGIGVQWDEETGMLRILNITEGGPGERAGLAVNDEIYMVNGEIVQGIESSDVIPLIKGEEGTVVQITVLREGQADPITFDIERERIVEQTVEFQMFDNGIGYIAISSFDEVTTEQFEYALEDLKKDGMQGLILDLRNNPGGRLNTVTAIADTLLPECTITYTETKKGERRDYTSDAECLGLPLVVLINANSASASEILAGAVQDMEAGILVGVTTYGKGIVQTTIGLDDGSAIKLTMASYYTPAGRNIHGIGIEPDIVIDLPAGSVFNEVRLTEDDVQLMTAMEAMETLLEQ